MMICDITLINNYINYGLINNFFFKKTRKEMDKNSIYQYIDY